MNSSEILEQNIVKNILNKLIKNIDASRAVNNESYNLWINRLLKLEEAEVFLANYFARTINTVARVCDVMTALLRNPIDLIKNPSYSHALVSNLENLQDELGNASNKKAHPILMTEWINVLLAKLGSKNIPIEDHYTKFLTQETINFCEKQQELYQSASIPSVLGVSFAQEIMANFMMNKLFDGYRKNYRQLFNTDEEFDKTYLYFTVHVFGTEENHARLAYNLLVEACKTKTDLDQIIDSYNEFEKITIDFWEGIHKQLNIL